MRSGRWSRAIAARRGRVAWAPLLAMVVTAALVAACGRTPGISVRTAPSAPAAPPAAAPIATPAVPPAGPLAWVAHQLPVAAAPSGNIPNGPALTPAPSDGETAYVCAPAAGAGARVWLTHDRGGHWARRSDAIPPDATGAVAIGCRVIVDAVDPAAAVAQITLLPAGTCVPVVDCTRFVTLLTTDAGQTWAPLRGPLPTLAQMATRQGVTYALFMSAPRSASRGTLELVRSVDGRRTWTPVPMPPGGAVAAFWLNPFDGGLLALTGAEDFGAQALWTTADGGTRWRAVPPSVFGGDMSDLLVQQSFTDQPWRICVGDRSNWSIGGQHNTHARDIACTPDGGATWYTRHLDVPESAVGLPDFTPVAIADDGAVLVTTPAGLVRFMPGSATTAALGVPPPAGAMVYAAGAGAGVLWEGPIDNYPESDPLGRIFTADYR